MITSTGTCSSSSSAFSVVAAVCTASPASRAMSRHRLQVEVSSSTTNSVSSEGRVWESESCCPTCGLACDPICCPACTLAPLFTMEHGPLQFQEHRKSNDCSELEAKAGRFSASGICRSGKPVNESIVSPAVTHCASAKCKIGTPGEPNLGK